jgi:cytochrome bd-type quinol oxidase subunit 2
MFVRIVSSLLVILLCALAMSIWASLSTSDENKESAIERQNKIWFGNYGFFGIVLITAIIFLVYIVFIRIDRKIGYVAGDLNNKLETLMARIASSSTAIDDKIERIAAFIVK